MAEKVTIMRLKVDLQCPKCYEKVKKLLCKFPQIRDQVYDEKNNIVTIKVVCCSPEKLRDKLCCKGCGAIKSIEILEPPKPKPPEKPKEPEKKKPLEDPKEQETPKEKLRPPEPQPPTVVPIGVCCGPCYEGRPGGPCFEGYGGPPPCYNPCYGRPVYDSYGGGRPCYVIRCCDEYLCEDNTSACTIM
ncbi:hypothetical protein Fmac_013725 [Flemingia macrophylla]|uniref:Uncharacterized protein n=1 Tax=Flemingia macrophylla TaxID=520843 RepID=A0ABD1MU08_9FABA